MTAAKPEQPPREESPPEQTQDNTNLEGVGMDMRPEYQGYPTETLLQARPSPQLTISNVGQVAASKHWVARSAPGVCGGWYEDGTDASRDLDFINARIRPWKALLI